MSEVVHIRLGEQVKKEINLILKQEGTFANMTDFIRDCVRHRLNKIKEEAETVKFLRSLQDSSKPIKRLTPEEGDKLARGMTKKRSLEIFRKYGFDKLPNGDII